jgi:hypothetical protein
MVFELRCKMDNKTKWFLEDGFKDALFNEVKKGEPRENIRLININFSSIEQIEVLSSLISGKFVEMTDELDTAVITQEYYDYLKIKMSK